MRLSVIIRKILGREKREEETTEKISRIEIFKEEPGKDPALDAICRHIETGKQIQLVPDNK